MRSLIAIAFLLLGCGSDPATSGLQSPSTSGAGGTAVLCTPGHQIACACTGGTGGAQACNADGSGFDACVCGGGGAGVTSSSAVGGGGAASSSASSSSSAAAGGSSSVATGGGGGSGAAGNGGGGSGGGGGPDLCPVVDNCAAASNQCQACACVPATGACDCHPVNTFGACDSDFRCGDPGVCFTDGSCHKKCTTAPDCCGGTCQAVGQPFDICF